MDKWAKENGFKIPEAEFFHRLQNKLMQYMGEIFPKMELLSLNTLSSGLRERVAAVQDGIVVSIDQIYNNSDYHLESNRISDLNTMEIIGEAQRPGHPSLLDQVSSLPKGKPITLVDDGCFSGDTLFRIYQLMTDQGYEVDKIIVGIIIDRSDNRFVREYPEVILESVSEFNDVIDWVCERDFYIGVPLSGRTAGTKEDDIVRPCDPGISLPYCLPFGDPIKGASIPTDKAVEFSRFIIGLSCELWEEVEHLSSKTVTCEDIPRLPKGIDRDKRSFPGVLSGIRDRL